MVIDTIYGKGEVVKASNTGNILIVFRDMSYLGKIYHFCLYVDDLNLSQNIINCINNYLKL